MRFRITATLLVSLLFSNTAAIASAEKLVIAHRGASGYLPEHTLAAKAMAYAMGVDYIEQDVVMTKDNRLVVLHDHYLDRVTDVMTVFPNRYREVEGNKRWFAIDFTLAEIKRLRVSEGFSVDEGDSTSLKANYPTRFPLFKAHFSVSTLEEEIELIQGLNHSTGKNIGIYPEIKSPWFHRHEGKDISKAVLRTLKKYGYTSKTDRVFLQCFDPIETRRINDVLMPEMKMDINLVQLIAMSDWNETMVYSNGEAQPYNYDWMFKPGGMKKIAEYADGIGPWKSMIVMPGSTREQLKTTNIVRDAHAANLLVHPYTFRLDPTRIPPYAEDFEELLSVFLIQMKVDGVFTDFPDRAVSFVRQLENEQQ
mgnify:CR=1 FL=1